MVAKLRVRGAAKTQAALNKYGRLGPRAVAAALAMKGKRILDLATTYAPYDITRPSTSPPHIRDTGYSTVPSTNSNRMNVEVGFTAPHAYLVHETDQNYRIGGWKYLERAWQELGSMADIQAKVAAIIKSGHVPTRHETRKRAAASQGARRSGLSALRRRFGK